jgi:hypothetical protein
MGQRPIKVARIVTSAIACDIETFGSDVFDEDFSPAREACTVDAGVVTV